MSVTFSGKSRLKLEVLTNTKAETPKIDGLS